MSRRDGLIFGRTSELVTLPIQKFSATVGHDQNRNTVNPFTRQTGSFTIDQQFLVKSILWDIRTDGTYTCDFLTNGNGSTVLYHIMDATAILAGADKIITPISGDFVLIPGVTYYLSLLCDSSVLWWDVNGSPQNLSVIRFTSVWYTGAIGSYTLPIKLVGYYFRLRGLSSFGRYYPKA